MKRIKALVSRAIHFHRVKEMSHVCNWSDVMIESLNDILAATFRQATVVREADLIKHHNFAAI